MKVERLKAKDYEEFVDLINLVFCQQIRKVSFEEDMPYLYVKDDAHMHMQYGIRNETGKLVAVVGVIPYIYRVGEERFDVRVITNVATHTAHTGKGYMQTLLQKAISDAKAEGVDFILLHGHRERYRFSGFEMAGIAPEALYKSYNLPSFLKHGGNLNFSFTELEADDIESIRFCKALFDKENQRFERTEENFVLASATWQGKVYLVKNAEDELAGYMNVCARFGSPYIREIALTCPTQAANALYAFMQQQNLTNLAVKFSPFDKELVKNITAYAEEMKTSQINSIHLLKPERLIRACLELKRRNGGFCPNGKIIIKCKFGNLCIENKNGFSVCLTDEKADVTVRDEEIYTLLFGPRPTDLDVYASELKDTNVWFPVPFFIHASDLY